MRFSRLIASWTCSALLFASPCFAWWTGGHQILTRSAVRALPKDVPVFFREGGGAISQFAIDPDFNRFEGAPNLSTREAPRHFLDFELLKETSLPVLYTDYLKLLRQKNLDLHEIGDLPYALMEKYERLMACFAEYRRWPSSKDIQWKCLLEAGYLAHYAEDLTQPLHTSVHYDGRVAAGNKESPHSGIHSRVDALIEALQLTPETSTPVTVFDKPQEAILEEFKSSHSRVERVYGLESKLPQAGTSADPRKLDPELVKFTQERAQEATLLTARLFYTAWKNSAQVMLPSWLKRN